MFREIVFTGLINNIFDAQYESNGFFFFYESADESGNPITEEGAGFYPQAGVNFLFGVSLKF